MFDPHFQAVAANGRPESGAQLFFYRGGTSSLIPIYKDSAGTTPHANPVVANTSGTFPAIFIASANPFKIILKSAAGITLDTIDRIPVGEVIDLATLGQIVDQASDEADRATSEADRAQAEANSVIPNTVMDASVIRTKLGSGLSASVPRSVVERGATGDGVANDAAAINAAQALGPLHFTAGTYRVATALTLTAASVFEPGAVLVADGVQVTLLGDIDAGDYPIFSAANGGTFRSNVTDSKLSEIKAQWFPPAVVGGTTITRGRYAGHKVMEGSGLSGLDYCHIDGFMACRDTPAGLEGLAIGTYAGAAAQSLLYNTFVGYAAGRGKQISGLNFRPWTGSENTIVGGGTGVNLLNASSVTVVGAGSLKEHETGSGMTVFGTNAHRTGTTGQEMVSIGAGSAYNVGKTGGLAENQRSTHVGHNAANNATQSLQNTIVGAYAASPMTTGQMNTIIGYFAGHAASNYGDKSRQIAIGNLARSRVDDSITIGNGLLETVVGAIRIGASTAQTITILGPRTLELGDTGGIKLISGAGSPEGVVTANAGSIFLSSNGNVYRQSTGGATGWVPM